jgi:glucose/arabinose dehydrogenase
VIHAGLTGFNHAVSKEDPIYLKIFYKLGDFYELTDKNDNMTRYTFILIFIFSMYCFSCENKDSLPSESAGNSPESGIRVREGYRLTVIQDSIRNPRFLKMGSDGTLYVSLPGNGEIRSCRDTDGDGYFEKTAVFVKGHPTVHGMSWHDGWLWFTETSAVFRARDNDGDGVADEKETIIPDGELPKGGGHWWRPVLILNDRLYTSIGCSGNITDESDTERLKIWSFSIDGKDKKLFASGLRNTEKLLARPGTSEIWGMDHGSDWFGGHLEEKDSTSDQPITDFNPPCELNHYVENGFYGHPFIVGNRVPRYEYMDRPDIVALAKKTIPPAWSSGAHWAPNGFTFYTGNQFPGDCVGDVFAAYHGSWNRSEKAGYCVTRILFDEGRPYGELKYANFIGEGGEVLGRPVDVEVAPDGSLLISDDFKSKIYRLSYIGG